MPSTCFGHTFVHPQGSALQRICYKNLLSFKKCGLKYTLKYKTQKKNIVIIQACKERDVPFVFNFLLINTLYMFRALLAQLQGALYEQLLVHCVHVMSVGCYQDWSSTSNLVATNRHNAHAKYQLLFVQRLLKMAK
jgi:hypothetical protein